MASNTPQTRSIENAVIAAAVGPLRYGLVTFSRADTDSVSEKFGRKSTAAINFECDMPAAGLKIVSTIWARLEKLADGSGEQVVFDTALPKNVKALSEDDKDAYTSHVNAAAMVWIGFNQATDAAAARLMGQKRNGAAKTVLQPRLVKRAATSAPTA